MTRRNDTAIGIAVAWARKRDAASIVTLNGPLDRLRIYSWSISRQAWRVSGLIDRGEKRELVKYGEHFDRLADEAAAPPVSPGIAPPINPDHDDAIDKLVNRRIAEVQRARIEPAADERMTVAAIVKRMHDECEWLGECGRDPASAPCYACMQLARLAGEVEGAGAPRSTGERDPNLRCNRGYAHRQSDCSVDVCGYEPVRPAGHPDELGDANG